MAASSSSADPTTRWWSDPERARRAVLLGALLTLGLAAPAAARAAVDPLASLRRDIAIAEDQRRWDATLQAALRHADARIRARAARAVGRLQDTTTVPALVPLLADAEAAVRREAAFALGQIGHRSARGALEATLARHDTATAATALEALGKLGDRAATPAVLPWLDDRDAGLRGTAAVALWRLADSSAVGRLLEHADDPDAGARWRVIYALEKVVAPERVERIVLNHLEDDDVQVRASAARTLGRQKGRRTTSDLVDRLLVEDDLAVRVNLVRALQQVADTTDPGCAAALAGALADPHPYVRLAAATALGERSWAVKADSVARRAAFDSLTAHLGDPDAATRVACARALLRRGVRRVHDLAPLLDDPSAVVRVGLLGALALAPPGDALPELTRRVGPEHPAAERMAAFEAIAELKDRRALAWARVAISDTSLLVVEGAADALAALGDTALAPGIAGAHARAVRRGDADARLSLRDALRTLVGRAYADSVEKAHPLPPTPATAYPADFGEPPTTRGAVLHTTRGDIHWAFDGAEAPQTVRNFVRLARTGYFDGLVIHRVVPNFVIQDGDPTGTGSGGPGYTIRCEYNPLHNGIGAVGMALSGKDTGGSQWFITHAPQPHLDGRYTIFAHVTAGMDVVWNLVQGDHVLKVDLLE